MKPKTKFIKMFYKLPEKARRRLVLDAYSNRPLTLNICALEIRNNTKLGKMILKKLGYTEKEESE